MTRDFITPDEARERFGELLHGDWRGGKTFLSFIDGDGLWKPEYDFYFHLIGYRRYEG